MNRTAALRRNFNLMFWMQALWHVKLINIVSTLFFLHRGLTLTQIFYTGIVFAVTNLLLEVPSSYIADKWGRKKTLALAVVLDAVGIIIPIFAHDVTWIMVGFAFMGAGYACVTGTDDALVYDTGKELKEEHSTLYTLARYYSGQRVFKIITPVIGALIAQDLTEQQFITLLVIDASALLGSFTATLFITEPHHYADVHLREQGALQDAWKLIRTNRAIIYAILSRTLLFTSGFILWRYNQKLFVDLGVSVIELGIMWMIFNAASFGFYRYFKWFLPRWSIEAKIDMFNGLYTLALLVFVVAWFWFPYNYLLMALFVIAFFAETSRWPLFSEMFNKRSLSYNRATTLSLTNLLKSLLDIPLLFIGGLLVAKGMIWPFVLSIGLGVIVLVLFRSVRNSQETRLNPAS